MKCESSMRKIYLHFISMRSLRSLVSSHLGHFGPETELYIHFGPALSTIRQIFQIGTVVMSVVSGLARAEGGANWLLVTAVHNHSLTRHRHDGLDFAHGVVCEGVIDRTIHNHGNSVGLVSV